MNLICRDKVFCRVTIFSSQSLLSQMLSFCANRALHITSSTADIIRIRLKFGFHFMRLGVCTCLEKEKDLGGDREFILLFQINEAAFHDCFEFCPATFAFHVSYFSCSYMVCHLGYSKSSWFQISLSEFTDSSRRLKFGLAFSPLCENFWPNMKYFEVVLFKDDHSLFNSSRTSRRIAMNLCYKLPCLAAAFSVRIDFLCFFVRIIVMQIRKRD